MELLRTPLWLAVQLTESMRLRSYFNDIYISRYLNNLVCRELGFCAFKFSSFQGKYTTSLISAKVVPSLFYEFKTFFEDLFVGFPLSMSKEDGFRLLAVSVRSRQLKKLEPRALSLATLSDRFVYYLLLRWRLFTRFILQKNLEVVYQSDRRSVDTSALQLRFRVGSISQTPAVFTRPLTIPSDASFEAVFNVKGSSSRLLSEKAHPALTQRLGVAHQKQVLGAYRLSYCSTNY